MYIKQILAKKDRKLLSVEPETSVMDAVKFMTKYDIGSVIILTKENSKEFLRRGTFFTFQPSWDWTFLKNRFRK